jgi:DNA-binding protein YbaB
VISGGKKMIGETSFIATARCQDGKTAVKVTAVTTYGVRSVSVDKEITDEKVTSKVESAMEAAIKSVRVELQQKSVIEAARAAIVADQHKESIYAE